MGNWIGHEIELLTRGPGGGNAEIGNAEIGNAEIGDYDRYVCLFINKH